MFTKLRSPWKISTLPKEGQKTFTEMVQLTPPLILKDNNKFDWLIKSIVIWMMSVTV